MIWGEPEIKKYFKNITHPPAPSLKKRRGIKVPLFLREGFRVSSN
jgi:hypothetical protein